MTPQLDIDDGYTQVFSIGSTDITYRPVIGAKRLQILREAKFSFDAGMYAVAYVALNYPYTGKMSRRRARAAFAAITGVDNIEAEKRDAQNLVDGVWLELRHPGVANRPCDSCRVWWYNQDTGLIRRQQGKPLRRPAGTALPCESESGCPKGTPDSQKSLSPKNKQAYRHYLECRESGSLPADDIVRRNARLIREVERRAHLADIGDVIRKELRNVGR